MSESTDCAKDSRAASCGARTGAELDCGQFAYYATASLAPSVGDLVPCARHQYCTVRRVVRGQISRPVRSRAGRRSVDELLVHLSESYSLSATQLRRDGFTLRLVETARAEGRVSVEDTGSAVLVRLASAAQRACAQTDTTAAGER